jgi:CPA2 family monovalent cation:H+ antiporter-2
VLHTDGLIATVAVGLAVAFAGGFVATRLRLPAIVGYLLAGIVVGPFTPGFVARSDLAAELAEVGVILLMFGVGLHFSLRDLFAVRAVALPGALGQIAAATTLGTALGVWWGWGPAAGLVLGLAISVASTVVLLRALEERDEMETPHGRIAVGWLIVEDLFTVLVLVVLPALAPALGGSVGGDGHAPAVPDDPLLALGLALGKIALLTVLMLFVGTRAIPWLLAEVTRTGSRELFTVSVLAVALGVAFGSAYLFGASLALGAFLAGVVVSESDLSHRAAEEALPLRDAFAVLFFVSVGMLIDPRYLLASPGPILAVLAVIVFGKGLAALLLVAALGRPLRTGLTVAAGLGQVGEFSFILAEVGLGLHLLPTEGRSVILAAALLSITLNPLLFRAIEPLEQWASRTPALRPLGRGREHPDEEPTVLAPLPDLRDHVVVWGHGRVGGVVATALREEGVPYLVVESDRRIVEELRGAGMAALHADEPTHGLLEHAGLPHARAMVVAIPDAATARLIVDQVRHVAPRVRVVARTHSRDERDFLRGLGADAVVLGEDELAAAMVRHTLDRADSLTGVA